MDYVGAISSLLPIIQMPINAAKANRERCQELTNKLESLRDDLDIIKEGLEFYDELGLVKLQDLIYDIEDFFAIHGICKTRPSGIFLVAVDADPRVEQLKRINHFVDEIRKLEERRQEKSPQSKPEQGGGSESAVSSAAERYTPAGSPVGISEPKKVILDLLMRPAGGGKDGEQAGGGQDGEQAGGGQDAKQPPKVISIVGYPGAGKTALAREVHDHVCDSPDFDYVAWVEASGCNDKTALLTKILEKVTRRRCGKNNSKRRRLCDDPDSQAGLRSILADKRYLIFIDDVQQAEVCDDLENVFPEIGKSSTLILTTRFHAVAKNVCSSRPGKYVHAMQRLSLDKSKQLLWSMFYGRERVAGRALQVGAETILSKCDGWPLALIGVAKYLRRTKGEELDRADCVKVGEELRRHIFAGGEAEGAFRELRRALGQCYDGLPQSDYKSCMLYLSILPRNNPIKRESLVRKLIAEGMVGCDGEECIDNLINRGQECLEGLVNRCIVEPVQNCSWSKDAKTYLVNGAIMLEFIVHKSQSTNLVTLIRKAEVVRNNTGRIRRLSVQECTEEKFQEVERNDALSVLRSLTMFSGENSTVPSHKTCELFEKENCKLLRLLDLESCNGFKDEEFFLSICELVYLKYLSLRKTDVQKIPKEIRKLQCLQTLDIRETREIKLPEEVIVLPKLAFLFGQFVLPEMSGDTRDFLKGKSKLHTLGEIVVKLEGFEHIILEAKNLKKVKVRCRDSSAFPEPQTSIMQNMHSLVAKAVKKPPSETRADFVSSLQSRFTCLDSVSIHSDKLNQDILASLGREPCKISRMKLRGKLDSLPGANMLEIMNNLSKLQLSNTGLTSDALSILQCISCLEYLKLQDDQTDSWGGSFSVREDGFESLRFLCFQASKLPKLKFEPESMKSLTSLHLLCPDTSQMQTDEDISRSIAHITSLKEVILHFSAKEEIVAWKKAAKDNANRPRVNKQQNPHQTVVTSDQRHMIVA